MKYLVEDNKMNSTCNGALVSIIVPVFNVEDYVDTCIKSIVEQNYKNIEIIIVDDGSTDKSGSICDQWLRKDKRIKVFHTENKGLSSARNYGIENSSGKYIAFVDSDDYISCIFVSTFVNALEENSSRVAILRKSTEFKDGSSAKLENDVKYCYFDVVDNIEALKWMFYQKIVIGAQFKFCEREILDNIRFPEGIYYEDVATTYKMLVKSKKIVVVSGALYAYRRRVNSIINQKFSQRKMSSLIVRESLQKDKTLEEMNLKEAVYAKIFQMILNVFVQVPLNYSDERTVLWECIKNDRKQIIKDDSELLSKRLKFAAYFSYLGMNANSIVGILYRYLRRLKRI